MSRRPARATQADLNRGTAWYEEEMPADRLEGEWFRYSDAIKAWIEEAKRG